jgi:hypothetical protein
MILGRDSEYCYVYVEQVSDEERGRHDSCNNLCYINLNQVT